MLTLAAHLAFFANSLQNCKFIVAMNQSSFPPLNLYLVLCTKILIDFFMSFGPYLAVWDLTSIELRSQFSFIESKWS